MLLFSPIVAASPTNQTKRRSLWNCLWEGSKIWSVGLRGRTLQIAQQMYLRIILLMCAGPLPMRGTRRDPPLFTVWWFPTLLRTCHVFVSSLSGATIFRKEVSVIAISLTSKTVECIVADYAKCVNKNKNTSLYRDSTVCTFTDYVIWCNSV